MESLLDFSDFFFSLKLNVSLFIFWHKLFPDINKSNLEAFSFTDNLFCLYDCFILSISLKLQQLSTHVLVFLVNIFLQ